MKEKEQYLSSKPLAESVSLGRVFWGYGVLGFFIVSVLGNWFIGAMQNTSSSIAIALIVSFIYSVVWMITSWKSSGNYTGFSLWRFLTRVVITIIAMMWVYIMGRFSIHFLG